MLIYLGSLWSAALLTTNPSLIYQTHLSYYRAGGQIATTASYQASIPGLVKHLGIKENEAGAMVEKSVALARQARDDYVKELGHENKFTGTDETRKALWIAGSIGPFGAFLADGSEYRGDYTIPTEDMKAFHRGRLASLISSGVDILAIETIPSLVETKALLSLLKSEFPDARSWFTFTLRDAQHISDGTSLSTVLGLLESAEQVVAVGANCIPEEMATETLNEMSKHTSKPLVVYPNSGESWDALERKWYGERNEGGKLVERVKEWAGAGARIIGGCCRTRPEDIGILAETIKRFNI